MYIYSIDTYVYVCTGVGLSNGHTYISMHNLKNPEKSEAKMFTNNAKALLLGCKFQGHGPPRNDII